MLERMHVAGSKQFMKYLTRNNYLSLYSNSDLIKKISFISGEINLNQLEKGILNYCIVLIFFS